MKDGKVSDIEARKLALEVARIAGVKCPSTSALTMFVRLVEAAVLTKQSEAIKQARNEALEEAAKLCDTKWNGDADTYIFADACNDCAAAIREMAKGQP